MMSNAMFWISLCNSVALIFVIYRMLSIDQTTQDTNKLVNSHMEVQLRLHAKTARRLAMKTGEAADIEIAELAEQLLKEHEETEEKN